MPSILDEWATLLAVLSPLKGQQEKDISICREYPDYKYVTTPRETTDMVLLRRRVLVMAIQYLRDVSDLSTDRQDLSTISSIAQVSTQKKGKHDYWDMLSNDGRKFETRADVCLVGVDASVEQLKCGLLE